VIMVLDAGRVDVDLAAGVLACPRFPGVLRAWSWATVRRVRELDGAMLAVRPRRARCSSCHATQVLLPAGCLPGLGDAAVVVGAVLVAKASGRGSRSIAAELRRPVSTVRRWLRRVRGEHVHWLRRRVVQHAYTLDPEVLTGLLAHASPLADADAGPRGRGCGLPPPVRTSGRDLGLDRRVRPRPAPGYGTRGLIGNDRRGTPASEIRRHDERHCDTASISRDTASDTPTARTTSSFTSC